MFKRCLLAVIVALLVTMTSSQIASAADVNWDSAPRIGSKAQLARYIDNERRKGQTEFHFILTNFKVNNKAELDRFLDELVNKIAVTTSGNGLSVDEYGIYGAKFTYTIKNEYPGTRVANAYLSSNKQQAWMNLTNEEQKLYNIAASIVDEANRLSSEREKAEYIHKIICRHVEDFRNENDRNKTAIGALIDGYAQCQGYSDAFYMLGRMAGLNVGRIGGTAGGNGHEWNWITFADGKSYCVDVTLDDRYNTNEWFLATFEVMKRHHSCEWEIIPNLQ